MRSNGGCAGEDRWLTKGVGVYTVRRLARVRCPIEMAVPLTWDVSHCRSFAASIAVAPAVAPAAAAHLCMFSGRFW